MVAVDEMMPTVIWTHQFMECQAYPVQENTIYQDNQATIILKKNGKATSGERKRHIDTLFFFVADIISVKEVSVAWCPTEDMTCDFWTKPDQSNRKFNTECCMSFTMHPGLWLLGSLELQQHVWCWCHNDKEQTYTSFLVSILL